MVTNLSASANDRMFDLDPKSATSVQVNQYAGGFSLADSNEVTHMRCQGQGTAGLCHSTKASTSHVSCDSFCVSETFHRDHKVRLCIGEDTFMRKDSALVGWTDAFCWNSFGSFVSSFDALNNIMFVYF